MAKPPLTMLDQPDEALEPGATALPALVGHEYEESPDEAARQPADQDEVFQACVRKVEESEMSTRTARAKSERDRDYVDGLQLTQDEYNALVARGQPPIAFNMIEGRVDFYIGIAEKNLRDPKAEPRTEKDKDGADAFTDGLRYVIERAKYPTHRQDAWSNIVVEGYGGLEMWVEPERDGNYRICIGVLPWDRLLIDPHSAKKDFSDAKYVGIVTWMDQDDAIAKYRETAAALNNNADEIIGQVLNPRQLTETYDDKPRDTVWADYSRKRVKIITMWCRHTDGWTQYVFTAAGMLDMMPSPYMDNETGENYCPWILDTARMDRNNERRGAIRTLIDPQDEVNKRRSKALHLLMQAGVVMDEGAVENKEALRRELAKPNFIVSKTPGMELKIERNLELVSGQVQMMQSAAAFIEASGPNKALLGDGVQDQSGKAIGLQQAGGLIEQGALLSILKRLDLRVFTMAANMIKQFWTAEKWIRVSDDPLTPRFVGLNVPVPDTEMVQDPETGQPMEIPNRQTMDPMTGEPAMKIVNNVADLMVDIIISDAPDVVTLDDDTYTAITQLLAATGEMHPAAVKLAIELHPKLSARMKKRALAVVEEMNKPTPPDPLQQKAAELEVEGKAIDNDLKKTRTMHEAAKTQQTMLEADKEARTPVEDPNLQTELAIETAKAKATTPAPGGKKAA